MHRLLAVLPLVIATRAAAQPVPALPPDLDAHVRRAMKAFEVPGLALAIVKDGRVLLARGYGVRRLGASRPVDGRTRFGIASCSKQFTAVALALLVEEGKLEWDAPVVRYLPWFQLADPYVTRELTVRDLLVHRSGLALGAGDLLQFPRTTYTRKEIVRRLRHLPLASSFRSRYDYDNILYLVAGEVIEAVAGRSWEEFVQARILTRLRMTDSSPRMSAAARGGNVATPHAPVARVVRAVPAFTSDATDPAGGINTTARDIARWLLALVGEGLLPDGMRLFSAATARELTTVVTPMPIPTAQPELAAIAPQFRGYALGLSIEDYRGHKLVRHDGGLPGYTSRIALLPSRKLAFAIFTNQQEGAAVGAIAFHLLDHYLGVPRVDWVAALGKVRARQRAKSAGVVAKLTAARHGASRPSLPLVAYAGTYRDAWYGDITLTREAGKLVMRFTRTPGLVGELEHWHHDTFVARWRDRSLDADAFVTFALDHAGAIEQVKMKAVSPDTDFSYDFHHLLLKPAPRVAPTR